jgi:uncharacterized coiled-coil protein SlyX
MADTKANGATEIKISEMTVGAMIEILSEAIAQLQETVDELNTKQDQIIEKLDNLSLDNSGFETYED